MKKQLENISLSLIFGLLALAGIALGCGGGGSSSEKDNDPVLIVDPPPNNDLGEEITSSPT